MFNSLSCSALKCYETCPRKFKFEYVDRLGAGLRKGNPNLSLAKSVHAALADFYRRGFKVFSREAIQSLLLVNWEKSGYRDPSEESAYFNKALEMLEKSLCAAGLITYPLFIEDYFRIYVGGFTVTGRIDRVDSDGKGGLEVIDYKTGKYLPTQPEIAEDLQMRIYALAAREKYRKIPGVITVWALEHGLKVRFNPSPGDFERTEERVKSIFLKISDEKEFQPRVNRFCGSCDFNQFCKMPGSHGISDLNKMLSEMAMDNAALKLKSQVDSLTKLYNRPCFEERLADEINTACQKGLPVSLIMLDIDYFKKVNDTFGHNAGDKVLSIIAEILKKNAGAEGFAARYGGEEFVCLLPGIDAGRAAHMGEVLRAEVENTVFSIDGIRVPVTISVGIAQKAGKINAVEIIGCADKNLYKAKNSGRNRVVS